jgi:hypothetical protein
MAGQEALMQEARVKRVWAILHFFTQFGFIVFTYLSCCAFSLYNSSGQDARTTKFKKLWLSNLAA